MKRLMCIGLTVLWLLASFAHADASPGVIDASITLRHYTTHMLEGRMTGSTILPLVFKIDANRRVVAMISGNVTSMTSTDVPPEGDALIEALRQNRYWGFSNAQLKSWPNLLLSLLDNTLQRQGQAVSKDGAIVLIRKSDGFAKATGMVNSVRMDQSMETTLMLDHGKAGSRGQLIVIHVDVEGRVVPASVPVESAQ